MTRFSAPLVALAALACNPPVDLDGEFDLDVTIPASYAVAHPNLAYALAVVEGVDGLEIDSDVGFLPASGTALVAFPGLLVEGVPYEVHLWVDSNAGGGTAQACDGAPDFFDHQWAYEIGEVTGDTEFTLPDHNLDFTDVCATAGNAE